MSGTDKFYGNGMVARADDFPYEAALEKLYRNRPWATDDIFFENGFVLEAGEPLPISLSYFE